MNNTTLENTVWLSYCDSGTITYVQMAYHVFCLILRLPISIFILQLIISGDLIKSEFYTLNEAIFEIFISFYDSIGVALFVSPIRFLMTYRCFFLGFIVTGRPCLLALICVERYLAVLKPVLFLSLKPLKYKMALAGIVWLCTLFSANGRVFMPRLFHYISVLGIAICCVVKLYCCIAILLALKQPAPGEGVREGMCNSKRKAFRIIWIITLSVSLIYGPLAVVLFLKDHLPSKLFFNIFSASYNFTAMSGFIQALLFLQRSGKLPCIKWP